MFALCAGLVICACNSYAQENVSLVQHQQLYSTAEHGSGKRQSPINIVSSDSKHTNLSPIVFNYHPSTKTVVRPGHTIQVNYDAGNTIRYEGRIYDFKQFHFHTPSEHLVDGVTYPMELHMVHVLKQEGNSTPVYLVIGLLFKEGKANPFIDKFINSIPDSTGATNHIANEYIDINELLKQAGKLHYYHYDGSLTTPPYTETVNWFVVNHVFEASPEQIEKINSKEGNNARHIQEIEYRQIDNN